MKLLLSYIIGLFLILSLSACHDGGNATTLLHQADSLMQEFPDSALSLLESISHPEKLSGSERADYAIFLTRARTKLYVHESSDSLIRFAVDYYKRSWNNERKMQAYYYRGCVYRDMRCMDLAVKDFLQALKVIPKESEYLYLGAIYENLAGCYAEQNLYKDAMHAHHKAHEIYIKQKKDDGLFYAVRGIGYVFMLQHQLDSALVYYRQVLEMASALQRSDLLFAICSDIAALYNEQDRYAEAEFYISKALSYQSSKKDYTLACSTKGDILGDLNQSDSAIYYWKIGAESSNIYVKASSYDCLFREYKKMKLWKESTLYADSFFIYYDSIQAMNDRAELDKLMDNHLVELHKRELSARNQWIIVGLVAAFLVLVAILIILYLWRDGRRKKKYVDLQQRLMENRAEAIFLSEVTEASSDDRNAELEKLEKERFQICLSLFETTAGSKRLDELKKATPSMQIKIADTYRALIVSNIRKSFADVMGNLKERYPNLTNDDLLYCVLSLLRCPKDVILHITNVSADAIKVRKNRIKGKIDAEQFSHIFDC